MIVARVALIGFGEVGQTLAEDLCRRGAPLTAWDTAFANPASAAALGLARFSSTTALAPPPVDVVDCHLVRAAASAAEAVAEADLVISAVTAAQDLAVARSVVPGLPRGAFFLDLNSCSPGQKVASAEIIESVGGRYVEAALMSPIGPKGIASPMLLGGPHAQAFLTAAANLGFAGASPYSPIVGPAAATKLCRSVVIKGFEALLMESLLAARHYGVEQAVLDSLSDLLPLPSWNATAHYMISRSIEHGSRRAEEMREAGLTVDEAGVAGLMSRAAAQRQERAAAHKDALSDDLGAMLDSINKRLGERG